MKQLLVKIKENDKNIIIFILSIILLTIPLMAFYPGIVPIDGQNQWNQVESNYLRNNHPFFSTFIWWLLSKIWNQPTILMILQILILSLEWTKICKLLRNKQNFKKQVIYTIILFMIPLVFLYAITAWKDIIYSYMLILLAIMIYIGIEKDFKYSYKELFIIALTMSLIMLYRYNGIIVVACSIITFLIIFIKHKYGAKKILISLTMFIVTFGVLKIPEKILCHPVSGSASYDVIFFTFAPLVINDKIDNEQDLALINEIYQIDKLKEEYDEYLINPMGTSKYYNQEVYAQHYSDILKMLIKYSIKHPLTIIRHYLKSDNLLIGPTLRKDGAYIYVHQFTNWEPGYYNFDGLVQTKFKLAYKCYLKIINLGAKSKIVELYHMPANIMYISIILMLIYCKRIKNKKYLLLLLPMLFNTLSLAAVNLAQDLRYVYINYLTLFLIILPLIIFKREKEMNIEIEKNKKKKEAKTIIIVPAYNEELNIEKTIKDITTNTNYDYIVINDCSKDNTLEVCKKNKFNVISLPVNYGLTSGIQVGMKYAYNNSYDIVIQFDGDGQHQAKYLKDLVYEIEQNNVNIAIGSRFVNKKKPHSLRMLGSNLIAICIKIITGKTIKDTTSGMRAYDRQAINEFVKDKSLTPEPDTLVYMLKKGYVIKEVQVEMRDREFGESYLKPLKSIEYMFNMIFSILFIRSTTKGKKEEIK